MTGLNHVLTGAAIALTVREPLLVAPLALISHFILDCIPHFDHPEYKHGSRYFARIMLADGFISLVAVITIMFMVPHLAFAVALGALFAILPDFFWLYYYMHGRPQWWFFRFHAKIQWFERPLGGLVEIVFVIFISTLITTIK